MGEDLFATLAALPRTFPGIKDVPKDVVYLMGCRSVKQFCGTIRSLADPERFCPFCPTERERRDRMDICDQLDDWLLIENEFPHKNVGEMLLIIPRQHLTHPSQLQKSDWGTVGTLLSRSPIENGGVMFRFGDPRWNVGTVPHLHFNIIRPVPGKEYRPPFAKNDLEHAEDYARMLDLYDQVGRRGGREWLFSTEGIQETLP